MTNTDQQPDPTPLTQPEAAPDSATTADQERAGVRRQTRQRTTIESYLAQHRDFQTAQQVFDHLRTSGHHISLATVYRTLTQLAAADRLDQRHLDSGEVAYRFCATGPHHHLMCRDCHKTVEIAADSVERWAADVASEHGFAEMTHDIELSGVCADCVARTTVE
ncbi:MAG: transcriptional repressor [Propionibacteriaceae bacterium]|jgi:Fur family ferric uptake transcriptional regulator|nr:transcriptional repressor [Propionibacteriaceae bacterium]